MQTSEARSAVDAALSTAVALGLEAKDAVVLHASNRTMLRLLPCDVVARVAPMALKESAEFEVEVARRLAEAGSPVAALEPRIEPRVYLRDGLAINFWTYYEPVSPQAVTAAEYAEALERLHAGMRGLRGFASPHFTDRVAEALQLVDSPAETPDLADADRELLDTTLRTLSRSIAQRGTRDQLLHGEPHPGNLLRTKDGLLFIDFETCCRGPVEFDIAHGPEDAGEHYPGADQGMLRDCRVLILAMVAAWRWDRNDQFPGGRQMGIEFVHQVRAALANGLHVAPGT